MKPSLSKHRHISFTAHYTGYIWYKMGISHQVFATRKGRSLVSLAHPLETWAEKFVGGSMRSTLKQRHQMLDQTLEALIAQYPDLQVLEIACGLSPRGWWFRQQYPNIEFRELDLPNMAAVKQAALKQLDPNSPDVLSVDLFTPDFATVFELFDPKKPLVIISEGLINYFSKALLGELLDALSTHGHEFKQLHYLTDWYPEPTQNKLAAVIWHSSKLLKWVSRSAFSFHFTTPQEIQRFFNQHGFAQVQILQPAQLSQPFNSVNPEQHAHLGDLVWMVHAQHLAQS